MRYSLGRAWEPYANIDSERVETIPSTTRRPLLAPASSTCDGRTKRKVMGDRSPKSKQRDQKQKDAARSAGVAAAKSKQDSQSQQPAKVKK